MEICVNLQCFKKQLYVVNIAIFFFQFLSYIVKLFEDKISNVLS